MDDELRWFLIYLIGIVLAFSAGRVYGKESEQERLKGRLRELDRDRWGTVYGEESKEDE